MKRSAYLVVSLLAGSARSAAVPCGPGRAARSIACSAALELAAELESRGAAVLGVWSYRWDRKRWKVEQVNRERARVAA